MTPAENPSNLVRFPSLGLPGAIYRSPMPFSQFDRGLSAWDEIQAAGVEMIVMLSSEAEAHRETGRDLPGMYAAEGIEVIALPIPDYSVPETGALGPALAAAEDGLRAGKSIVVHCLGGIGRTGLFAAVLAGRLLGMGGDEAIGWVRSALPEAVETPGQEQFIHTYLRPDSKNQADRM